MKLFLLCCLLFFNLFAQNGNYNNILKLYKKANYKMVCRYGKMILNKLDDNYLSLVGNACAKEDDIQILGKILPKLNKTKNDRLNASYFATLILEKKLIYQFMNDNIKLTGLTLPKTNHILSRVFEKLAQNQYTKDHDKLKNIQINDGIYKYILWLSGDKPPKVYIDEYKNGMLVKKHWFR